VRLLNAFPSSWQLNFHDKRSEFVYITDSTCGMKQYCKIAVRILDWGNILKDTEAREEKQPIHYIPSFDGTNVCLTLVKCWITSSEKPRCALTNSGGVRASHCERETSWKTSFFFFGSKKTFSEGSTETHHSSVPPEFSKCGFQCSRCSDLYNPSKKNYFEYRKLNEDVPKDGGM